MKPSHFEWGLIVGMAAILVIAILCSCSLKGVDARKSEQKAAETRGEDSPIAQVGDKSNSAQSNSTFETAAGDGSEITNITMTVAGAGGWVGMVAAIGLLAWVRKSGVHAVKAIDRLVYNLEVGKENDFPARVVTQRLGSYVDCPVERLIKKRVCEVTKGKCDGTKKHTEGGVGASGGSSGGSSGGPEAV